MKIDRIIGLKAERPGKACGPKSHRGNAGGQQQAGRTDRSAAIAPPADGPDVVTGETRGRTSGSWSNTVVVTVGLVRSKIWRRRNNRSN
jgi:hypothetical protein